MPDVRWERSYLSIAAPDELGVDEIHDPVAVTIFEDETGFKHLIQRTLGTRFRRETLAQLELHLEVPERESARIAVGQNVSFTLDAAQDRPFEGEVVELASVVHTRSRNQPAKVIDATVALRNPDSELMRPGMSVNAEIQL